MFGTVHNILVMSCPKQIAAAYFGVVTYLFQWLSRRINPCSDKQNFTSFKFWMCRDAPDMGPKANIVIRMQNAGIFVWQVRQCKNIIALHKSENTEKCVHDFRNINDRGVT